MRNGVLLFLFKGGVLFFYGRRKEKASQKRENA